MAALATTTLNGAVTRGAASVRLTSTTDVTAIGMWLFVDGEAMQTLSVPDNQGDILVMRGLGGTRVSPHATALTVYIGTSAQFYQQDPSGTPPTWPTVTPWINLISGAVWTPSGDDWTLTGGSGSGTGTGLEVFQTSPTLITPTLGAATVTSVNRVAITAPATGSTLVIADGKTFTVNQTLTLTGTTGTTMTFPATSATIARTDAANTFTGVQTMTSPVLVTPDLGTPSAAVLTNATGTAASLTAGTASAVAVGGVTGLGTGVGTALAANTGATGGFTVNGTAGVAAGYKVARVEMALDGSNPTSWATGLASIVSATVTLAGSAAPGVGTSVLTALINGTSLDVYAWKVTSNADPTLIASTGTETFYGIAVGT